MLIKLRTVLLVEDNLVCQKLIALQLDALNYSVDLVEDAREALQKIKRRCYSLIVIDLGLPDFRGEDVIKIARQGALNKHTPIIVSSAQILGQVSAKCIALGADIVLMKPYELSDLEKAVRYCFSV